MNPNGYHMQESRHEHYMRQAVSLARRGQGRVEPNPMVGAVLVRDGRVVAGGYHKRFGGPHAEMEVLGQCRRQGIILAETSVAIPPINIFVRFFKTILLQFLATGPYGLMNGYPWVVLSHNRLG